MHDFKTEHWIIIVKEHVRIAHDEVRLVCEICKKKFIEKRYLRLHLRFEPKKCDHLPL